MTTKRKYHVLKSISELLGCDDYTSKYSGKRMCFAKQKENKKLSEISNDILLHHIFPYLLATDWYNIACVCKEHMKLLKNAHNQFWNRIYFDRTGYPPITDTRDATDQKYHKNVLGALKLFKSNMVASTTHLYIIYPNQNEYIDQNIRQIHQIDPSVFEEGEAYTKDKLFRKKVLAYLKKLGNLRHAYLKGFRPTELKAITKSINEISSEQFDSLSLDGLSNHKISTKHSFNRIQLKKLICLNFSNNDYFNIFGGYWACSAKQLIFFGRFGHHYGLWRQLNSLLNGWYDIMLNTISIENLVVAKNNCDIITQILEAGNVIIEYENLIAKFDSDGVIPVDVMAVIEKIERSNKFKQVNICALYGNL